MQGSTTAQPQDDDQSKRVIEDVEAGESDDVIASKRPWWARPWKDSTGKSVDDKLTQRKIDKLLRDTTRQIEEILKVPDSIEDDFPPGYPLQAAFQSSADEFSIYRNFNYLHSRVILEIQDELRELERQLRVLDKKLESQYSERENRTSSSFEELEAAQPTSPISGAVDTGEQYSPGSDHDVASSSGPSHPVQHDKFSSRNRKSNILPAMVTLNGGLYQRVNEMPESDQLMRSVSALGDTQQQNGSNASNKDPEADPPNILRRGGVVGRIMDDRPESDQLVRSASSSDDSVQHDRPGSRGQDPEAARRTLLVPEVTARQAEKPQDPCSIKQPCQKKLRCDRAKLLDDIQQKLVRYDEVLVHARRLAEFQRPTDEEWLNLRKWHYNSQYKSTDEEGDFIRLKHDLITLRPRTESGKIDDWIERLLGKFSEGKVTKYFYKPHGQGFQDENIRYFDVARIERLAVLLVAIVIILLLAVPVFVMFRITWLGTRASTFINIALLIGFGLLFSVAMGLLTRAKRAELFAATAAYCAVLVVFIGNFSSNVGSDTS